MNMYAEQTKSTAIGAIAKNQAIAEKLTMKAQLLDERLMSLEKRVSSKLEPICEQPIPMPEGVEVALEEWPPYFSRLRELLTNMDASCNFIERTINRVAL